MTLLVSLTRYILTRKSAKNIQPSNKKVSIITVAIFGTFARVIIATCFIFALFDLPLFSFVDVCAGRELRPRLILAHCLLHTPNIFNILALIMDIQMIQFLKKVIIPPQTNFLQGLGKTLIKIKYKLNFKLCLFLLNITGLLYFKEINFFDPNQKSS